MSCLLLLAVIFCVNSDPTSPIYPETFSISFIQGHPNDPDVVLGRFWYDYKNQEQRTDLSASSYDSQCLNVSQDQQTSCSKLFSNDTLYIHLPQKQQCCILCNAAGGCKVTERDWMRDFKYDGEAVLDNGKFYRWSYPDPKTKMTYFETEAPERIPRRVEFSDGLYHDCLINTYSSAPIPPSTFFIPPYCKSWCKKSVQQKDLKS